MPAVPEITQGICTIGVVKIAAQSHAQQRCRPDGNVGIAGKVPVDLPGKKQCCQQNRRTGGVGRGCVDGIHKDGGGVCQQQLFGKAAHHPKPAACIHAALRVMQLRQKNGAALNRSRYQLREKADKQGVVSQMALRFQPPAVDVDDVAKRLECVK